MQMGRWFGYRPGYVDLCRLFTTNQIFEWFNHITMATEEMRNDFDEMTATHQRPKDFRLKVRNHHGLLTITSLNKLHFSEDIEISFSGENPQTYCLLKTKHAIENNFNALKNLIGTIGFPTKENRIANNGKIRNLFYPSANVDALCGFIDAFKIEQPSISNATLTEYIRTQARGNKIKEWSICIVSNTDQKVFINRHENNPDETRVPKDDVMTFDLLSNGQSITLGCSVRNQPKNGRFGEHYTISKNQIDDLKDRQVDLAVKDNTKNSEIKEQRAIEKKGLLLIYLLDERGTPNVSNNIPIVGYSLHFPRIEDEIKVSYTASIDKGFDEELMTDDDNPETENQ
jgi:hypothetical protein